MAHAFISYSTKNKKEADYICEALHAAHIATWMAPQDIPLGEKYATAITQAIRNCGCFVLLFSDASQKSKWVSKELERAIHYDKTIITLCLEDIPLNDEFEFYISTAQSIPFFDVANDKITLERIIASVKTHAGESAPAPEKQEDAPRFAPQKKKIPDEYGGYYYGEFPTDKITGYGEHTNSLGDRYVGNFVNGKAQGRGELFLPNGAHMTGIFVNDRLEGKGVMVWQDGSRYVGDFDGGMRTGQGEFFFSNGDHYIGDFQDGGICGSGEYFFANGNRYTGEFADGHFEGKGEYIWQDGDRHVGLYHKGLKHGEGTLFYADGRRFEGVYHNNDRVSGTLYAADGSVLSVIGS